MSEAAAWVRTAAAGATPERPQDRRGLDPSAAATVARLAYVHQVGPWLAAAVRDGSGAEHPFAARLRRVAHGQSALTLAHRAELRVLLEVLASRDIEPGVLKGPALGSTVYPEEGLRPYRDLDLLVHEDDALAVAELLTARGYVERYPDAGGRLHPQHGAPQGVYEQHQRGLRVELHRDHLQLGVEPVDMAAIWARSRRAEFDGVPARVLETHDLFVHLCVHLHRHSFSRLIWFKDLDLLVRGGGLEWALVRERADEQGCLDSVALSLELLEALLAPPLPREARALVESRAPWTRWLQRLLWRRGRILDLEPQRRWRGRRLVQFAPESGLLAGGLPSLLSTGRRRDKLRVLAASLPGRRSRRGG